MKKCLIYIFILILCAVILPVGATPVKNTDSVNCLDGKIYYNKDDMILCVYELSFEQGIGCFELNVKYNGDNFDFDSFFIDDSFTVEKHDNAAGKLRISAINNSEKKINSVKFAAGFRSLNMLDPDFIEFSPAVTRFYDCNIEKSDDFLFNSKTYVYTPTTEISYEDYANGLIKTETLTPDTDTDSDKPKDTETKTSDSDKPKDTETKTTDSDKPKDTETKTTDSDKPDDPTTITTDTDAEEQPKYKYGDLDNDNVITAGDALWILRGSVGLDNFSDIQFALGDVDGDKSLTSADSLDVLRVSVGLESYYFTGKYMD